MSIQEGDMFISSVIQFELFKISFYDENLDMYALKKRLDSIQIATIFTYLLV